MKASVWVDFSKEIEVEVSLDELFAAVKDLPEPQSVTELLTCLNRLYGFSKRVPNGIIAMLNDKQRDLIYQGLMEQAVRYLVPSAAPQRQKEE